MSRVFPTHVGVFPERGAVRRLHSSLPHTRGGVSPILTIDPGASGSSPHTWGCFSFPAPEGARASVFPTHVGVFLGVRRGVAPHSGLPHTRGGVSRISHDLGPVELSSPHTWGCFLGLVHFRAVGCVFPTHVGVFLLPMLGFGFHAVFPTHVGVFLCAMPPLYMEASLPHTRGGVSQDGCSCDCWKLSSPHTWGCFHDIGANPLLRAVFPTHVGVFLLSSYLHALRTGLPHTRGGVSAPRGERRHHRPSSPHTWGCFRSPLTECTTSGVFPTHVGVFP